MKFKSIVFIFLMLICAQVQAFDGLTPDDNLFEFQCKIFRVISNYWEIQDLYDVYINNETPENESNWVKAMENHSKKSVVIGKRILESLKKKQLGEIELLSEIYKSLEVSVRPAVYPALGYMKVEISQDFKEILSEEKFREYFPGYGYTEPGYKYRKGRETKREYKGVTWQQEEHSISTTWNVNLTVSIDVLNILKGWLTGGLIKNLKVSEQFQMNVGGQPMICFNVTFQRVNAITTKTNRKFEINKIWFELLRSKSSGWSNSGEWEKTGETYEILHEPTGEEVVTGIQG